MGPEVGARATTSSPDRAAAAVTVERGERPGDRPAAGWAARAGLRFDEQKSVPRPSRRPVE